MTQALVDIQGRIQDGGGGSDKYIHNWGEGTGGGVSPPVTALHEEGFGGALIAPNPDY